MGGGALCPLAVHSAVFPLGENMLSASLHVSLLLLDVHESPTAPHNYYTYLLSSCPCAFELDLCLQCYAAFTVSK